MKIKHIAAVMALSLPGLVSAVPADPRPRKITNPDGSVVTVRVHGDEYFNFMTDEACTRLLQRDARGFVSDMMRDGAPVPYNETNVRKLAAESLSSIPMPDSHTPAGMQRMATLDFEGRSNYPTKGEGNRSLVVLVEFEDVKFTVKDPKDYFTRQLNEAGFSDYGGSGSALDYYIAASNGLYVPQFDVYGPVQINRPASYYSFYGSNSLASLIRESLTTLHDAGEIDFSKYDLDDDGVVDTVFFYYAGYGAADSDTETIWPHQSDYRYYNTFGSSLRFDERRIGPYACANELKGINPNTGREPWKDGSEPWVDGIGTFVHEYGHVLGLPDLYDTNPVQGVSVKTPGDLSVMASGCYNFNGCVPPLYSAYEQWLCRWLDYTEAEDGVSYDLPALGISESPKAVRIGIPSSASGDALESEYFLFESRDRSGWDRSLPESGLYVWRINYNKNLWNNNTVNSASGSNVEVIYANSESRPAFTDGIIYPGGRAELIPSKQYEFWKSPIITDISYDSETMTGRFDFNMITEMPSGAPLLHDTPFADEGGARGFTLVWDPVEGADSYQVTIRRASTGNVMGEYDEYDVGNVTSLHVAGVSLAFWINELEAYVRAVKGLPCVDASNVVRFIPKSLPVGGDNAVGSIEAEDAVIAGGLGCVMAPDGAQVFDMAGKRLSREGLAPGVYIVVFGSRTEKVLVR